MTEDYELSYLDVGTVIGRLSELQKQILRVVEQVGRGRTLDLRNLLGIEAKGAAGQKFRNAVTRLRRLGALVSVSSRASRGAEQYVVSSEFLACLLET